MNKVHELKTNSEFFEDIVNGKKTFELRKNDRDFNVGDTLNLMEWNTLLNEYTGREIDVRVNYILKDISFGLQVGYVIMGIK